MVRKADGSTSGTLISDLFSASPPWNIAKKTELPVAKTYLCAGITCTWSKIGQYFHLLTLLKFSIKYQLTLRPNNKLDICH